MSMSPPPAGVLQAGQGSILGVAQLSLQLRHGEADVRYRHVDPEPGSNE
jgi:hypothetical protein